jgi:hypothetical protein
MLNTRENEFQCLNSPLHVSNHIKLVERERFATRFL